MIAMDRDATPVSSVGRFALRHSVAIAVITAMLCIAGAYSAFRMPSSLFPTTTLVFTDSLEG